MSSLRYPTKYTRFFFSIECLTLVLCVQNFSDLLHTDDCFLSQRDINRHHCTADSIFETFIFQKTNLPAVAALRNLKLVYECLEFYSKKGVLKHPLMF
jgi:hypothetical protein